MGEQHKDIYHIQYKNIHTQLYKLVQPLSCTMLIHHGALGGKKERDRKREMYINEYMHARHNNYINKGKCTYSTQQKA